MRIAITSLLVIALFMMVCGRQLPQQSSDDIKTFEEMVKDARAKMTAQEAEERQKKRKYEKQEQEGNQDLQDRCRDVCGGGRSCSCWSLYGHGCPCLNGFPPGHHGTPDR